MPLNQEQRTKKTRLRREQRARQRAKMEQVDATLELLKEEFGVFQAKKLLAVGTFVYIKKHYFKQKIAIHGLGVILKAYVAQKWYLALIKKKEPRYFLDGITIQDPAGREEPTPLLSEAA